MSVFLEHFQDPALKYENGRLYFLSMWELVSESGCGQAMDGSRDR